MRGRDLKCPTCGEGAKDVAPGLLLGLPDAEATEEETLLSEMFRARWEMFTWTCANGHQHREIV